MLLFSCAKCYVVLVQYYRKQSRYNPLIVIGISVFFHLVLSSFIVAQLPFLYFISVVICKWHTLRKCLRASSMVAVGSVENKVDASFFSIHESAYTCSTPHLTASHHIKSSVFNSDHEDPYDKWTVTVTNEKQQDCDIVVNEMTSVQGARRAGTDWHADHSDNNTLTYTHEKLHYSMWSNWLKAT